MKFIVTFFTILFIITLNPAQAVDNDFTVVQNFAQDLRNRNYDQAQQYVSANSGNLYSKYSNYDLGNLTPGNIKEVGHSKNNGFRYLKLSGTNTRGGTSIISVALITEQNQPKIDLPETMRLGFGPNWQQKVSTIEQSYLFTKQNFGDQQSRQLLLTLLQK